ncbi:MAG: hypothetical protein GY765_06330 [bacterium]|nr:hypothetical protein [bacterium]
MIKGKLVKINRVEMSGDQPSSWALKINAPAVLDNKSEEDEEDNSSVGDTGGGE